MTSAIRHKVKFWLVFFLLVFSVLNVISVVLINVFVCVKWSSQKQCVTQALKQNSKGNTQEASQKKNLI